MATQGRRAAIGQQEIAPLKEGNAERLKIIRRNPAKVCAVHLSVRPRLVLDFKSRSVGESRNEWRADTGRCINARISADRVKKRIHERDSLFMGSVRSGEPNLRRQHAGRIESRMNARQSPEGFQQSSANNEHG